MPSADILPSLDCLLVTYPIESVQAGVLEQLRKAFKVVHFYPGGDGSGTPTEYEEVLPPAEIYEQADVILAQDVPENLVDISQTPRLKLWQVFASGTQQIVESAFVRSIPSDRRLAISNLAGVHAVSIAEHVMMTTLMHCHQMNKCLEMSSRAHWAGPTELGGLFIREIRGMTFGILTYGAIAREIARLATAFGARIIVCTRDGCKKPQQGYRVVGCGDPDGSLPAEYYTTEKESLHTFLSASDVVVNMMPASSSTYRFIGRDELVAMKDNALFVNAGRGTTVDQEALVEALSLKLPRTGKPGSLAIGGAALDVTDPEPLPDGHPLFSLPNAIITPHCSYASERFYSRVVEVVLQNKALLEAGGGVLNVVKW
ncbi:hypothetical protein JCM10207_007754 [Rhodosporidiobolus poonsookiae]